MNSMTRKHELEAEMVAQAAVRRSVAEMSLGDRDELVLRSYVRLLEGESWWDVQYNTGIPEDACRQMIALRDEIVEQLKQRAGK